MSDFIERARALDKAATGGPWGVEGSLFGPAHVRIGQAWGLNWRRDLEFTAAARSMLPAAVEALARVREMHGPSEYGCASECRDDDGGLSWPCATYQATEVEA